MKHSKKLILQPDPLYPQPYKMETPNPKERARSLLAKMSKADALKLAQEIKDNGRISREWDGEKWLSHKEYWNRVIKELQTL